ncbi:hypothetical protein DUT91_24380, partial [Phyllobacterium salinisoli]
PRFVDPDHLTHHSILLVVHPFAPSVFVEGAVKSESAKDSLRYLPAKRDGAAWEYILAHRPCRLLEKGALAET